MSGPRPAPTGRFRRVTDPEAPRRRGAARAELWAGVLAVAGFIVLWQVVAGSGLVNPVFTGSPVGVARQFAAQWRNGQLLLNMRVSGSEFVVGYVLAVVAGVPAGLVVGWYRMANAVARPFVSGMYSCPRVALIPLMIIWLGIGIWSKVAMAFLSAVFPIVMNTQTGVRAVNRAHVAMARSFCASDQQLFRTVVVPGSVPFILAGLRLGIGHALIGVVTGELYGASAGIGYQIASAGEQFQTNLMFVGIVVVTVAGIVLIGLFEWIEKRLLQSWNV